MTKEEVNINYFNEEGHLSEIGISIYAEYLLDNKKSKIPDQIVDHVEDCNKCKLRVKEAYFILTEFFNPVQNNKSSQDKSHRLKIKKISYLAYAAIIIAGVLIGLFLWNSSDTPEYIAIYNDYFTPYPDIHSERGYDYTDSMINKFFVHYNMKRYKHAEKLIKQLTDSVLSLSEIRFYHGIVLMKNDNLKEAERIFMDLTGNSQMFDCYARWYLSLIYIKNGKIQESIKELKYINLNDSCHIPKSRELHKLLTEIYTE